MRESFSNVAHYRSMACVDGHIGLNNQRELQRHGQEWRGGGAARREFGGGDGSGGHCGNGVASRR